ncbi:MAG: helicase-associated domain-containing protein [Ardenticatenaceae bacterium]|nr:helicase-associated domain-containing protein [Ardenticatenaceae bacterium]
MKIGSIKKGWGYQSRVQNGVRRGETLQAEVRGSSLYQVDIEVTSNNILATCSCHYDWGGYCKHVAAVLLKWIYSRESFSVGTAVATPTNAILQTTPSPRPPSTTPQQKPAWLQTPFNERQELYQNHLKSWLSCYRIQDLRELAQKKDWAISGTRKDDIIAQIIGHMLQPGIVLKTLQNLDEEHRQVYQALALLHTKVYLKEDLLETLTQQWGPLKQYKKIATYVSHLIDEGLALPGDFSDDFPRPLCIIPTKLRQVLPPLLADRLPEASLPDHNQSELQLADPDNFVHTTTQIILFLEQTTPDLRRPMPRPSIEKFVEFLRHWDYVPEEVAQAQADNKLKGHDPKFGLTVPAPLPPLNDETVKRLSPIAGDADRLSFFYNLAVAAGLLQPGSPVQAWREVREQFLRHKAAEQWAILARTYFEMTTWSEIWLVLAERPNLHLKRSKGYYYQNQYPENLYQNLALFRQQVLQVLACLPDDRWFSLRAVNDILALIWTRFDGWGWSHNRYGNNVPPPWFLEQDGRSLDTANNKADWHMAQGAFIKHLIQGPLHWLGLVDLSLSYGELTAFRLHGLADLFWDKTPAPPMRGQAVAQAAVKADEGKPASAAITITDTTITVDPAAISAQAHNYLDNIAILGEADPGRFVYRLYAPAAHQAFESGQTLDQILEAWGKLFDIPIPDAIQSQLTAWWQAYGQVRLYENVTVIEFGDDYALAEMKAATSLEKHLIAEISPRLILIPEPSIDILVAELEKAGYTPKQSN